MQSGVDKSTYLQFVLYNEETSRNKPEAYLQ